VSEDSKTTISLLGIPLDLGAGDRGSIMGPAALRIAGVPDLLEELGYRVVDRGDIARPEPVAVELPGNAAERCNHLGHIAAWTQTIHDRAYEVIREGGKPIFLGGDHAMSMGSISAVARHCAEIGKTLAVVWIDAHADYNTPATSLSGNMHGMPLAFLTGEPSLRPLLGDRPFTSLAAEKLVLIGLRSIDKEERRRLRDAHIQCVDMGMIDKFGVSNMVEQVLYRIGGKNVHLHVSLDVDGLDPTVAPGVGTTVPGGLTYREAHLMLELLHGSGLVGSLDIVELNPFLDHRGMSARVLAELTGSLFGQTILGTNPL
jgi:arginase